MSFFDHSHGGADGWALDEALSKLVEFVSHDGEGSLMYWKNLMRSLSHLFANIGQLPGR